MSDLSICNIPGMINNCFTILANSLLCKSAANVSASDPRWHHVITSMMSDAVLLSPSVQPHIRFNQIPRGRLIAQIVVFYISVYFYPNMPKYFLMIFQSNVYLIYRIQHITGSFHSLPRARFRGHRLAAV